MKGAGLCAYGSTPRCGIIHWPVSTICCAASTNRGSSGGEGSRRPIPAPSAIAASSNIHQIGRKRGRREGGICRSRFEEGRHRHDVVEQSLSVNPVEKNLTRPRRV